MQDVRQTYRARVIAVGGPPHTGKTVFIGHLYQSLLAIQPTNVFLEKANPDGEGMWYLESGRDVAEALRKKGNYSPDFVAHILRSIPNLAKNLDLLLLDLGGKIDDFIRSVLSLSTHLIVISSKTDQEVTWLEAGARSGCTTLACFRSEVVKRPNGEVDTTVRSELDLSAIPLKGVWRNLVRFESALSYEFEVRQLASWLHKWQVRSRVKANQS